MTKRPPVDKRKFVSQSVEEAILEINSFIKNEELKKLFENSFPNTLDTTITYQIIDNKPDTFVITGDIDAMWLRDSTAQVFPYLQFINKDIELKKMVAGVINRQIKCILLDPYANAFINNGKDSEWSDDLTIMKAGVHERKWELDSLCYPIRLVYHYWKISGDTSCFDQQWFMAVNLIYDTIVEQQRINDKGQYYFQRKTHAQTDTVPGWGYGNPIKPNGLICSTFRPSDDSTIFPFLIPSNYFAVVSLKQISEILIEVYDNCDLASKCFELSNKISITLKKYAISELENNNQIIPYEIDGFGNKLFMDDANIPSLLSLPYLGCIDVNDELYVNTRKYILSENNPYYFKGQIADGIGSPHVGLNMIWSLSIIMQALTSQDEEEIIKCITYIIALNKNTGLIHESVNKDNVNENTRDWFAWANSLFGELILKLYKERKELLLQL